ncbi:MULTISPECIES: GntR family transcriptional regulator [unclassified Oceanobacter]|jgi:DNA-binding GntR family transcriptional regulator|uniref:GntR family transcriptional regulator n=1 Tax=unclassified Oceanobacter TaxID=2620260 RepID=UPI0026E29F9B|nr:MULTISPECIES: GntR family transcriptional regulator [unclassified Oceanobacter]MDO6682682.1 GntR family transcriptional regulator [Oceanobacter sp. 5_MG-2023]MDP2549350.1 GntR family transcriptional regulator [Oceanobacter sp. 4_MG-2023]MDP2609099.1 GntR family transcriptional regulator [Oceanobacter sp. 1_MG-2023]MDP2612421.1 GntR family transcriptional regulator [Oceanobacter sp. 2_MG-2023]
MDKHTPIDLTLTERHSAVTITQWVYSTLRQAVLLGKIPPGRALTIRELATLLDVSPMPIREALRQLSAEGALEIQGNRRVMVPKMTAMKFAELVEARICLETHSAVRAMPYIDEARLAQLEDLDHRIDIATEHGNGHDVTRYNQEFHRLLYTANPHQVTQSLIESLWLQLAPFMQVAIENLDDYYQVDRHKEAISAIRERDSLALQMAISADIRDGCAFASSPEQLQQLLG